MEFFLSLYFYWITHRLQISFVARVIVNVTSPFLTHLCPSVATLCFLSKFVQKCYQKSRIEKHISQVLEYHGKPQNTKEISSFHQFFD